MQHFSFVSSSYFAIVTIAYSQNSNPILLSVITTVSKNIRSHRGQISAEIKMIVVGFLRFIISVVGYSIFKTTKITCIIMIILTIVISLVIDIAPISSYSSFSFSSSSLTLMHSLILKCTSYDTLRERVYVNHACNDQC